MAAIAENAGGELMQDSVSQTLAIEMLDGIWQAGDSLTLEDMQSRFGISRTVAREVAKTLESLSAVWVRRRVGLVARPFSEWQALNRQVIEWRLHSTQREQQLYSLTELRLAVEPAAAASAARLAPIDVKAKFPVYAAQMRQAAETSAEGEDGLSRFHELDVEFHSLILRESGNELFAALAGTIATVLRGRVELGKYPMKPKPAALDAHDAVADAIAKGEPERARTAMLDIVDEVARALKFF
ncbi:MAG: FadR/GntR family transcriptional regulator [Bifidobacterium dentium]